jgi:hypothetical protein
MVTFVTSAGRQLEIAALSPFLDTHVLQFAGFEDLATLQALYEFSVFVAADDLHTRMLARWFLVCALRGSGRLGGHKAGRILRKKAE